MARDLFELKLSMLQLSQLAVDYGANRVIDDVTLTLGADEILMLVGPTGCGKSTILQAVAGLVPLAAGTVSLGGWQASPAREVPPEQRNVGMVFQDFALFPHLSVEQNVCFRLRDTAVADHWLKVLGLDALRRAKPERLSGGQKQRVALARALAHEPALMLLDEPLSNLDAALKDSLRWEIRDALKAAGVPAIWVTHDQSEALSIGDRVGVLRDGRLQQVASAEACFSTPANRFVARFLGEACFLPAQVSGGRAETALGSVPVNAQLGITGTAEVMARPDDFALAEVTSGGHGEVTKAQYEGSSWLYSVGLDSDGLLLLVRVSHENRIPVGARVALTPLSAHPLMVFESQAG